MRKKICLAFVALWMSISPVFAVVVPMITNDTMANISLKQQLMLMRQQYMELKKIHATQKGTYGRGRSGLKAAIEAGRVVPGSWQDVVGKQRRGKYGAIKKRYDDLLDVMPENRLRDAEGVTAKNYKLHAEAVVSAMAGGEALFGQIDVHVKNMRTLANAIDKTKNSKDAQDLRNRIAVENGMLQTAMGKTSVLLLHLQAHVAHQHSQAMVTNLRYFNLLK